MGKRCSCCWDPQGPKHKDFIRGGVDEGDFEPDYRPVSLKKKTKKKRARSETRMPCLASEDGRHVYIWVGYNPEFSYWGNYDKTFYKHFGYYRREQKVCCGCGVSKGFIRETERYLKIKERKWVEITGGEFAVKRGEPVSRRGRYGRSFYSFTWENEDPDYMEKVTEEKAKRDAAREADRRRRAYIAQRQASLGLPRY